MQTAVSSLEKSIHIPFSSKRSSSRLGGMGVGRGCTSGTFRRKDWSLLRDRSSAQSLATPDMCLTESENPTLASMKNIRRKRCINSGVLFVVPSAGQRVAWY